MSSPFDEAKYNALLKGLEITEVKLSKVTSEDGKLRIEAEHFQKKYAKLKEKLSHHNCARLAELVSKTIQTGHTPSMKNEHFYGGNIKFIKTDNLRDNEIKNPFSHYLSELGNSEIKRTELQEDDIITTIIGATYDVIARSCIIHKENLPANINQNIALIRPDKKKIVPEYLNVYLNSKYGKMYLEYLSRQMEQVNLNCEEVGNVVVPLFTPDFQQKIESLVKSAHAKLAESKSLYAQAEDTLLSELGLKDWQPKNESVSVKKFSDFASSGRLDAEYYQKKYDELFEKLNHFKCNRLGDMGKFCNGSLISDELYVEKAARAYIRIKELSYKEPINDDAVVYIDDSFVSQNETTVCENDFVIATIGNTIGKVNAIPKKYAGSFISNNTSRFRLNDKKSIYFYYEIMLRSIVVQSQIEREFTQTAQPKISNKSLANILIPILSREIQEQIAKLIQKSFALRAESKLLLDDAKASVEREIEKGKDAVK